MGCLVDAKQINLISWIGCQINAELLGYRPY